jgi:MraZ protein
MNSSEFNPLLELDGPDETTLDGKNRFGLPGRFAALFKQHQVTSLEVTLGYENNLLLYPPESFRSMITELEARAQNAKQIALLTHLRQHHRTLDIDGTNRILLPSLLVKVTKLEKDVVVMGSGRYLSVMSLEAYFQRQQASVNLFVEAHASGDLSGFKL